MRLSIIGFINVNRQTNQTTDVVFVHTSTGTYTANYEIIARQGLPMKLHILDYFLIILQKPLMVSPRGAVEDRTCRDREKGQYQHIYLNSLILRFHIRVDRLHCDVRVRA